MDVTGFQPFYQLFMSSNETAKMHTNSKLQYLINALQLTLDFIMVRTML